MLISIDPRYVYFSRFGHVHSDHKPLYLLYNWFGGYDDGEYKTLIPKMLSNKQPDIPQEILPM